VTAEIAVLNREAVVLASDSAVTSVIGGEFKISPCANKLFAVSHSHAVGVMFYNNAQFMGVPWETLIKIYRKDVALEGLPRLTDYCEKFLSFVTARGIKFPASAQREYLQGVCASHFRQIAKDAWQDLQNRLQSEARDTLPPLEEVVETHIEVALREASARSGERFVSLKESRRVLRSNRDLVRAVARGVFVGIDLSDRVLKTLEEIAVHRLSKTIAREVDSGIVFAGFGEDEYFPSLRAVRIEGLLGPTLKCQEDSDKSNSIGDGVDGGIVPFADENMVVRFMTGVDPDYVEAEQGFMTGLVESFSDRFVGLLDRYTADEQSSIRRALREHGSALVRDYFSGMNEFVGETYREPVLQAVSVLPKNELASLAEALVHLASLRAKFSADAETVTEPIDVAAISKGDGFVWMKRKHYFDKDLNPDFFLRRQKEIRDAHKQAS
jgi:hypothetical protein